MRDIVFTKICSFHSSVYMFVQVLFMVLATLRTMSMHEHYSDVFIIMFHYYHRKLAIICNFIIKLVVNTEEKFIKQRT